MSTTILASLPPEYIHVLINPLPVYGVGAGLIGLFIAVCQRSRRATIAALVVILICGASAWPVFEYGQRSYDGVLTMADNDGRLWLAEHARRAGHFVWFFYALAVLSALGLIVPAKWPRSSLPLSILVLILGLASLGAGGYIAYAGGRIRHREFRTGPPPKKRPNQSEASTAPTGSREQTPAHGATKVTIERLKYSPDAIAVRQGETVEWTNNDLAPHTVTSQGGVDTFDSGSIEPDASWSHTFSQPGTFSYACTFHPEMKGTITVK